MLGDHNNLKMISKSRISSDSLGQKAKIMGIVPGVME